MRPDSPHPRWLLLAMLLAGGAAAQQDDLAQRAARAAAAADWQLAQGLYAELTKQQTDDPAAWYQLGVSTLNAGGDTSQALAAFSRARELGQPAPPVLFGIARAHAQAKDRSAMFAAIDEMVALGPSRGLLRNLQSNPAFEFVRSEPAFAAALQALTPCTSARYRDFDFWLGAWRVVSPTDQPLGRNTVVKTLDGCMLTESWESAGGGAKGFSINYYDSASDRWTQTYRDNTGNIAGWPDLRGGLREGAMVLENLENPQNMSRWTWTRIDSNKVRQMAESSSDGGQNWQVVWDSYYLRETESVPNLAVQ